jgi:hypothetical protein
MPKKREEWQSGNDAFLEIKRECRTRLAAFVRHPDISLRPFTLETACSLSGSKQKGNPEIASEDQKSHPSDFTKAND